MRNSITAVNTSTYSNEWNKWIGDCWDDSNNSLSQVEKLMKKIGYDVPTKVDKLMKKIGYDQQK